MIRFKGRHFPKDILLTCLRWYLAYQLSYRDIEEMMAERGTQVDHSAIQRWVDQYAPKLEAELTKKWKRPTGSRWRMDETYIKVKGEWKYLYRAVDKSGNTIDFLLTAKRDKKAALRFFKKAIGTAGEPALVNIDKSGANTAALEELNKSMDKPIEIRQCKYLNNVIEQDHRPVKEKMRQARGGKKFHSAHNTVRGVERWLMLKKGQHVLGDDESPVALFYALAA
ncbi:MAG: IS6 family transposase [Gammaproteobacteria bacterium]